MGLCWPRVCSFVRAQGGLLGVCCHVGGAGSVQEGLTDSVNADIVESLAIARDACAGTAISALELPASNTL